MFSVETNTQTGVFVYLFFLKHTIRRIRTEEARERCPFSSSFVTPKHASLAHYAPSTLGVQLPAAMAQTAFLALWTSRSPRHLQATLPNKTGNFQETNEILCKEKKKCEKAVKVQGGELELENVLLQY